MAAPTNAAKREESSCQLGAVHTWHNSEITARAPDVRFRKQSGRHLLLASISPFGPISDVNAPWLPARSAFVTNPALPPVGALRHIIKHRVGRDEVLL